MSPKQTLLNLAEKIDAVVAELEDHQQAEKLAEEKAAEIATIGRIGSTPALNSNPMLDFLFNS